MGGYEVLPHLSLEGGGFGVGTDVSVAASARADWMFAKHFGITMGAAAWHFQISNTVLQKALVMRQTVYGPIFGFGLYS
jgi:hypothetical protein